MDEETIVALSTPLGRGGIAVLRISGPGTREILTQIIEKIPAEPKPRRAYHGFVVKGDDKIDECVVVYYRAPGSYTGEDLAEISIHSNPFIIEEVLELILQCGARSALAGEFTYRAFKNGKMDLIQAESVNELIAANSRYYATMKFGSLEGRLSRLLKQVKDNLVQSAVKIETRIEFEEDQYLDEINPVEELQETRQALDRILANARFNEVLDKGLKIVVVGKVNVGKSSLFNALLSEERAITSHIPGTTRDYLQEKIYVAGLPMEITDVAGINSRTEDELEIQGIRRSLEKVSTADAVIFMLDGSRPADEEDREIYELVKDKHKLVVVNKIDIADPAVVAAAKTRFDNETVVEISVKRHDGIEGVFSFLSDLVRGFSGKDRELTVNHRQKKHLEKLREILETIGKTVHAGHTEIVAEEIRSALDTVGQLMGEVTTDDILNGIFSQFCIGK